MNWLRGDREVLLDTGDVAKRTSMYSTDSSSMNLATSVELVNIFHRPSLTMGDVRSGFAETVKDR